jgi:hypothetical protein
MSNQSGGGHLYRRFVVVLKLTRFNMGFKKLANMVSHKNCELKFYSTWILT